ncbi:efflux RND transporter periplasmic adaptor subunit [Aporhodopirellula aestuarii]|uniref:Efflux RND transporter periplasmic adaptor subunit n=1 Tax=Aporhodopirellula aestuarii TaxID=2950107 RepID=A0ABT0U092_9BACT|nr:efflux RND transporter periplasmic adaptor subunit [Aporhodopirellula aestuarii]MCM2370250.1 efflux RND transporter periplasmic adaptor subunit [Aporhodopirellula aestuarii]
MSGHDKKQTLWLRLALTCVAVLCLATAFIAYRLFGSRSDFPELRTVQAEQRDLVITVGTTGTIEPEEVVQVGADVAGKITEFGTELNNSTKTIGVGDRVKKGTLLFKLDPEQYEIGLQKAEAAYRLAQADITRLQAVVQQARRNLERADRLRSTNAQSDYDEIVTANEMAVAQLAVGQAKLDQVAAEVHHARSSLAKTVVRSPIDGIVIDRRANLGQYVSVGHPGLFLLAKDLDQMRIRASVSESDIGKVRRGQRATFTVDAYRDQVMTGRVEEILLNARMHGNFVTYDVIVGIDQTDVELLPHMTTDVEFEIIRRNQAWLVPTGALTWWPETEQMERPVAKHAVAIKENVEGPREGDTAYVWVPGKNGKVRPMQVRVGIDDGVQTEVHGNGFADDMPVVVGVINRTTLARIIPTAKTLR